jgi:hypothetical protein
LILILLIAIFFCVLSFPWFISFSISSSIILLHLFFYPILVLFLLITIFLSLFFNFPLISYFI